MSVEGNKEFGHRHPQEHNVPVESHDALHPPHGQSAGLDLTAVVMAPAERQIRRIIFGLGIIACIAAGYFAAITLGFNR